HFSVPRLRSSRSLPASLVPAMASEPVSFRSVLVPPLMAVTRLRDRVAEVESLLPKANAIGTLFFCPASINHVCNVPGRLRPSSRAVMLSQTHAARSLLSASSNMGWANGRPMPEFLSFLRRHSLAIHIAPSVAPWPAPTTITLEVLHAF